MVKHHFQHLSSQAGESHNLQEPTGYQRPSDTSMLSDIEHSNKESSLIKLLEVDRAAALVRTG